MIYNSSLDSHTHCQAAHASRTNQSLSKSVSEPTHGQKKKKKNGAQQSIKNIGQTRVSDSFALSTNFLLG